MIRTGTSQDITSVQEIAHISWNDTYEGISHPKFKKIS